MRVFFRRFLAVILLLIAAVGSWIAFDLIYPTKKDLRAFDPNEVARLDGAMWRAYYERDRVRLYLRLGDLLGRQYGFRFWRRQVVAFRAARAAFIFKNGRERRDYEQALPDLTEFFSSIREGGSIDFDPQSAAKLELEWWIVHRERRKHSADDLAHALADAAAEVYKLPADRFLEYGNYRAQAMRIRDEQAESGGVTEDDWARIDELLQRSWQALHQAVNI